MRVSLCLAALLTACGSQDLGPTPDDGGVTTNAFVAALSEGRTLEVRPAASSVLVTGHYLDGHSLPTTLGIGILSGRLDVGITGRGALGLAGLRLELADVVIAPGSWPLYLTGIHVTQDEPVLGHADWSLAQDRVTGTLPVTLLLDWSLLLSDGSYPLRRQRIDNVTLRVQLTPAYGHVLATLTAQVPETFWDWGGMLRLSDLELGLTASDLAAMPPLR